jgi:PHD/YefM family antitoxin component YafN of YafNO toxin-antitoxin module
MNEMLLDTNQIHPVSDFIRNHKAHIARLKRTHAPEVLTVNGRAEVVMLDTESYQSLVERVRNADAIARTRANFAHIRATSPAPEPLTEEEVQSRRNVLNELVAETERLGLYK